MQLAPKTEGQAGALALKLSNSDSVGGLKLKLGDDSTTGYGVQGLPGIYVDGPAPAAAEDGGGLKFKLGESSASSATATPQPVPSMGIPGLPVLNLASVEPSQAAQLAETASTLTGTERVTLEDAALQAARKNPGLTAPGDDPFVADYRKEAQGYDAALQQRQQALQKASEAEGHIQADLSAINYAQGQIKAGNATEAQKQDFQHPFGRRRGSGGTPDVRAGRRTSFHRAQPGIGRAVQPGSSGAEPWYFNERQCCHALTAPAARVQLPAGDRPLGQTRDSGNPASWR
jgi:hypothetical protein